jgi:hypothetical protein
MKVATPRSLAAQTGSLVQGNCVLRRNWSGLNAMYMPQATQKAPANSRNRRLKVTRKVYQGENCQHWGELTAIMVASIASYQGRFSRAAIVTLLNCHPEEGEQGSRQAPLLRWLGGFSPTKDLRFGAVATASPRVQTTDPSLSSGRQSIVHAREWLASVYATPSPARRRARDAAPRSLRRAWPKSAFPPAGRRE